MKREVNKGKCVVSTGFRLKKAWIRISFPQDGVLSELRVGYCAVRNVIATLVPLKKTCIKIGRNNDPLRS